MTQALTKQNEPSEIALISPADAKAWELVNSVLTWMAENSCYNYSEAFRQLGVAHASFYRAIKMPFVQGRLAERFQAQDVVVFGFIEQHWLEILEHQARIAAGYEGSPRDSTPAARFLDQVYADLRERLVDNHDPEEGQSRAAALLNRFKAQAPKTVVARRVVEEVEIVPDEEPARGVIEA